MRSVLNPEGNPVTNRLLHQGLLSRKPRAHAKRRVILATLVGVAVLIAVVLGSGGTQGVSAGPVKQGACDMVGALVGTGRNAGQALQACIDGTPEGGTIEIAPGRYLIDTPIRIVRPVTVQTRSLSVASAACSIDEGRCASFHLAIAPVAATSAVMPFDIDSSGVRLDGLVFEGTRLSDPALSAKRCLTDEDRPMAGGLRINGNDNVITRSVFRDMACYTALEYGTGKNVIITDNMFSDNGTHDLQSQWADGLTIHSGDHFKVTGNRFRDNTDVQLIFGSCISCVVTNNRLVHSGSAKGGSFAEVMLHAWPGATSGDYTGTKVSRNFIDCGMQRRCGFGIMIGSMPWYDAPAFGGAVTDNIVRGAMLALNIDKLTGPMEITRNDLNGSTGTYPTMCGPRSIRGITTNISPSSRPFLPQPALRGASFLHYCILNFRLRQ